MSSIDERSLRGLWLLSTSAGVLTYSTQGMLSNACYFKNDTLDLSHGLIAVPAPSIGGHFTVMLQCASQQAQGTTFISTSFQPIASASDAAQLSFIPTGTDGEYLLAVADASGQSLGYMGVVQGGARPTAVVSAADALPVRLLGRVPTAQHRFQTLLPGEVVLHDGPNFSGGSVVIIDGADLMALRQVGVLQGVASLRPGPQTALELNGRLIPEATSLSLQYAMASIRTHILPAPRFAGTWALQVFEGNLVTCANGALGTRPVSGTLGVADYLWFYEATPPADARPGAPVVEIWNAPRDLGLAAYLSVQGSNLVFSSMPGAAPSRFYAELEDATDQSPAPLWSLRDVETHDLVTVDEATGNLVLTGDPDRRVKFQRLLRNPGLESDSAFPQQVGLLGPGQVALFGNNDFTQNAWVVEQSFADTSLLGCSSVASVLLGEGTEVLLYPQTNYQGQPTLMSASAGSIAGGQGVSVGSFQIRTIETAASELIRVSAELVCDQPYLRGGGFQPARTMFRVALQHVDEEGEPIPFETFELEASAQVIASCNGQRSTLGPGASITAMADATGRLSLCIEPGQSLSLPSLAVRTSNMPATTWVRVRPDEDVIEKLAAVTGDELRNGVAGSAAGQGKAPLLSKLSEADAAAVAQALNNAASILSYEDNTPTDVHESGGLTRLLAIGTRSAQLGAPRARVARPSAMADAHWSFRIDGAGKPTFQRHDSSAEALAHFFRPAALPRPGGMKISIGGVLHVVVTMMEEAVEGAKQVVESAMAFVRDGTGTVFELALNTAEDICNFAGKVFEALESTVASVLDFLAFVFDWNKIKAIQGTLAGGVSQVLSTLGDPNHSLASFVTAAQDSLNRMDGALDAGMQDLCGVLGHDPSTVTPVPPGGREIQTRLSVRDTLLGWLREKVLALMDDFEWPSLAYGDLSPVESGLRAVWTQLTTPPSQMPSSMQEIVAATALQMARSGQLQVDSLSDISSLALKLVSGMGHDAIQTARNCVDVAFTGLLAPGVNVTSTVLGEAVVFPELAGFLNSLVGIEVPTLQEVATLLIAVPLALSQALQGSTRSPRDNGASWLGDLPTDTVLAVVSGLRAIFEPLQDTIEARSSGGTTSRLPSLASTWLRLVVGVQAVLDLVKQAATVPAIPPWPPNASVDMAIWWVGCARPLSRVALLAVSGKSKNASPDKGDDGTNYLGEFGVYGATLLGLLMVGFLVYKLEFSGSKPTTKRDKEAYCRDWYGALPGVFKFLRSKAVLDVTEGASAFVLLALDVGCNAASCGLSIAMAVQGPDALAAPGR
jgi:hypothetical protein